MAHLHFKRTVYTSGSGKARSRIEYITRQPVHELARGEQQLRYIQDDREDLVYTNSRNLPPWAHGKAHAYFKAAETYERSKGIAFEEWKMTLPKECTQRQNMELTRDLIDTIAGDTIPVVYAMHAPATLSDNGEQPHLHLLISGRRTDEHARTAVQHFRRYNRAHPEHGGAEKDPTFWHRGAVKAWRVTMADVINLHLAHHGYDGFVHPDSLKVRGIDREPEPKLLPSESRAYRDAGVISDTMQKVLDSRSRSPFARQNELRTAWTYWLQRKTELGITNDMPLKEQIARAVAARQWRVDRPPERRSTEHTARLECQHRYERPQGQRPQRGNSQAVQRGLRGLVQHLQDQEQEAGSALNVRIPRLETEREQGMGL